MKERYLDIMEQVVGAYQDAHIRDYITQVQERGVSEHGFPRLTANIGILLANGRRCGLKELFLEMMDICCSQIPTALKNHSSVGNEFSVREIIACLLALEQTEVVSLEKIQQWRKLLGEIEPYTCYAAIATKPPVRIGNWAAFAAASEQARRYAGIGCEEAFIDNQIASQLLSFDENGMYRDPNEPMVYDIVTRLQLSAALYYGYAGVHKERLEELLEMGGLQTLKLQSVTGELAYGGRSNQFLHNEAVIAAVCEFEAGRQKKKDNKKLAGQYKAAAILARNAILRYLETEQMHHVKNGYPNDSLYGCEGYGYFNKYMVTVASFIYLAYLFADDTIEPVPCPAENENYALRTSEYFHKTVCKFGEYFVQYDTDADFEYDANGLGRIHRKGAPSAICLSLPFTGTPKYHIDLENPSALSICGGMIWKGNDAWGCEPGTEYALVNKVVTDDKAELLWRCTLKNGARYTEKCSVSAEGVSLRWEAEKDVCCLLPVLESDGSKQSRIEVDAHQLIVFWDGWQCRYETDGVLQDLERVYANRNGHYRAFLVEGQKELKVNIVIKKVDL